MGNCMTYLGLKKLKRPVMLLLVGLDNSGKTTAAKGIVGDSLENVAPTVGFCPETLDYRGCEITIYDLGGGSRIRAVWSKYFSEIHGVIFVIDSSDKTRVEECQLVLKNLLCHKKVSGKPVLILANKQDVDGALDEIDLVESLKIEELVNEYKCPARVETCSAISLKNKKPDKPIADGFRWLVDTIVLHYDKIGKRVKSDVEAERKAQKEDMEIRRERLKKLREAQERSEEIARVEQEEVVDSDEEVIVVHQHESYNDHVSPTISRKSSNTDHSPTSSVEAQELQELGLSPMNLADASTTSSSSTSISVSLTTKKANDTEQNSPQLIVVQASPTQITSIQTSESAENEHFSKIKSSPLKLSTNNLSSSSAPDTFLVNERKSSNECIPIDSDDEMFFNIPDVSRHISGDASPRPPVSSNGFIMTTCVKEQLELEATLSKRPKKKTFLKRLNRTVPMSSANGFNMEVAVRNP